MDLATSLLVGGVSFGQAIIGIVTRPYETYRRIVDHGKTTELLYVTALLVAYFAVSSVVKTAAFRPFLLTKQFIKLALGAGSGYFLMVGLLWFFSRLVKGEGKLGSLAIAWAYTLIPTTAWFFVTSLLSVVLPPPRTASFMGVSFSILFLVFSATLFWWKATLAYLALRFGMRLDLRRILAVTLMSSPILGGWSYLMYRMGIFKVPFL